MDVLNAATLELRKKCGSKTVLHIALLFSIILGAYLIYQNGYSAGLRFDDRPNLSGLSTATDVSTSLLFITDGKAGPLGRPLSLLTFLLQKHSWPDFPADLIRTNSLIHIINALLITLLTLQIFQKNLGFARDAATLIAILITAAWVFHPFNSSAVLITIQRMTLLATTFVLLGLYLYVRGRSLLDTSPRKAYLQMGLGAIGCTILASLCKESGALLPFYALALEVTTTQSQPTDKQRETLFKIWKIVIFIAPTILLIAYFYFNWGDIITSYENRNFTLTQRLATESIILWEYVRQIIAPNISLLAPYHDDYPVTGWSYVSIAAAFAWSVLFVSAALLRRKAPLFSLGIFWYLAGHILESTIFPLELYFEHRNYLPSIGIIFVILFVCMQIKKIIDIKFSWIIAIYPLTLAFLLIQTTTLWGNQLLAANVWHQYHPKSARAAQNYSQKLAYSNNREKADAVINDASTRMPNDSGLALQALQLGCFNDTSKMLLEKFNVVLDKVRDMDYSASALDALHNLINIEQKDGCSYIDLDDMARLGNALLENWQLKKQPLAVYNLHLELSRISMASKDLNLTMYHLESAYKIKPSITTLTSMFKTLISAGLYDEARAKIRQAYAQPPKNIFKRRLWKKSLINLEQFIDKRTSTTFGHANSTSIATKQHIYQPVK